MAETARLKDVVKKKEENEKKYQGEFDIDCQMVVMAFGCGTLQAQYVLQKNNNLFLQSPCLS